MSARPLLFVLAAALLAAPAGYAFTQPKKSSKGYGVASACSVDGKYYAGSLSIPNAQADAEKGKLSLVFHGTRLSFMAECKGRFERSSAVDPLVPQSCP